MLLDVRVQPRARKNEVVVRDGRPLIRVTAPPVDGKANAAVCALLAKSLGVPKSAVQVQRGASSRDKVVFIEGMEEGEVKRCLGL
jgi:uncharacterized protein (TIGR00251 family)